MPAIRAIDKGHIRENNQPLEYSPYSFDDFFPFDSPVDCALFIDY